MARPKLASGFCSWRLGKIPPSQYPSYALLSTCKSTARQVAYRSYFQSPTLIESRWCRRYSVSHMKLWWNCFKTRPRYLYRDFWRSNSSSDVTFGNSTWPKKCARIWYSGDWNSKRQHSKYPSIQHYPPSPWLQSNHQHSRGHPCILNTVDIEYIHALLQANPALYLDEQLLAARNKDVSLATLSHTVWRLGMTYKDTYLENSCGALASNAYGDIPAKYFIWLDESSVDKTNRRTHGWADILPNHSLLYSLHLAVSSEHTGQTGPHQVRILTTKFNIHGWY